MDKDTTEQQAVVVFWAINSLPHQAQIRLIFRLLLILIHLYFSVITVNSRKTV